jgi:hypothetical protein
MPQGHVRYCSCSRFIFISRLVLEHLAPDPHLAANLTIGKQWRVHIHVGFAGEERLNRGHKVSWGNPLPRWACDIGRRCRPFNLRRRLLRACGLVAPATEEEHDAPGDTPLPEMHMRDLGRRAQITPGQAEGQGGLVSAERGVKRAAGGG